MKTVKNVVLGLFLIAFSVGAQAQEKTKNMDFVKTISLEQTKGEFTQKAITISEGTYVFEISNVGVDHEVGFVLAPVGKTDAEFHISSAYVTAPVATNTTGHSNKVVLKKGEYVYFCPLNPTPEYTLIVK
jgi:hypothetical protein